MKAGLRAGRGKPDAAAHRVLALLSATNGMTAEPPFSIRLASSASTEETPVCAPTIRAPGRRPGRCARHHA